MADTCNGDVVVAAATAWLGTPFVHQGSCRGAGADCLGLVRGIWRDLIGNEPCSVPAYGVHAADLGGHDALLTGLQEHFTAVDEGALLPGDVLAFRMRERGPAQHVGVLTAPDAFVHAYARYGVVRSAYGAHWRRKLVASFRFPRR